MRKLYIWPMRFYRDQAQDQACSLLQDGNFNRALQQAADRHLPYTSRQRLELMLQSINDAAFPLVAVKNNEEYALKVAVAQILAGTAHPIYSV